MDPLTIVSQSLPLAMATQPYSFKLQAIGGVVYAHPSPPYVWAIVPGYGTPPTGLVLAGDTLQAASGAISENSVGNHPFRIKATDRALTVITADVSVDVEPFGFSRTHQFLLDPRLKALIEDYLVSGVTREKVELHFFRDIVSAVATNFMHLDRDILVPDWTGIYPYTSPLDTDLRGAIDAITSDLLYFADPTKWNVSSVIAGPGSEQVNFTLTPTTGFFVGRNGETDATMARQWFRLVDCDSDDEPHDGDGNPLVFFRINDADGIEIDPNTNAYQVDADGFHSGKNSSGGNIGFGLTFVVEFVPNPHTRTPVPPWCVRSGVRQELHDLSPEALIKFGNVLGEVDADVIALIKTAPYVAGIKIGNQVVHPTAPPQHIIMQGQGGVELEASPSENTIRIASTALRTVNGVEGDGGQNIDLLDGEFIEIETEFNDQTLTIKTVIPVHVPPGDPSELPVHSKGLVGREDYAKFLELISNRMTRLHGHTGEDLVLGTPNDGFADGYIPLDPRASVTETVDRVNEAMLVLGGGTPIVQPLDGIDLAEIAGIVRERGFLCDGIGVVFETGVFDAGDEAPYVYNDAANISGSIAMEFETTIEFGPVAGTAPGPTDTLEIYINGSLLETWVLATGTPVTGLSPSGYMDVTSVRTISGGDAIRLKGLIDPSDGTVSPLLVVGYNYFEFKHIDASAGPTTYTSAKFKVFLDLTVPAGGGPALPSDIWGTAAGKIDWMSGVRYFSGDNELVVTFTANDMFQFTYYSSPFQVRVNSPAGWQEWTDILWDSPYVTGVSTPPDEGDNPLFSGYPTGRPVKDYSVAHGGPQPYLELKHTRPGDAVDVPKANKLVTPAGDDLIYTLHKSDSTDLFEGFEDEIYRINPYDHRWGGPDFPSFPMKGRDGFGWLSSGQLGAGTTPWGDGGGKAGNLQTIPDATPTGQPWEGALIWPQYDYTSGTFDPPQEPNRDYSTDFGSTLAATYYRPIVCKDLSRTNGTLQIVGIQASQLGLSYLGSGGAPAGDVNLEIKFPGSRPNFHSGWMDLTKLATGTYADGDGALFGIIRDVTVSGQNAVEIDWTGNGLNTRHSGEMYILRVTYRATTPVIYRIEEIG